MENINWLYIFVGIVLVIKLLYTPLHEIKLIFITGLVLFGLIYWWTKSYEAAFWFSSICAMGGMMGIKIYPSNRTYKTVIHKKPKKTWSEKRAEKKAKEKAYWQYVSDVEDEAISYED